MYNCGAWSFGSGSDLNSNMRSDSICLGGGGGNWSSCCGLVFGWVLGGEGSVGVGMNMRMGRRRRRREG